MSGSSVPYHLRPNKHVERQLFVELLERIGKFCDFKTYSYISMGGKFLSDFRAIHGRLGVQRMFSFEADACTYDRQVFNRPFTTIKCFHRKSSDFIEEFSTLCSSDSDKCIVWLDYTSPKDRLQQLHELQSLVSRLTEWSIVKVTMNANPYAGFKEKGNEGKLPMQLLEEQINEFFPESKRGIDYKLEEFAGALGLAIKKAIVDGIEGLPEVNAVPFALFRYTDSLHQMITCSAILVPVAEKGTFLERSRLEDCEFYSGVWEKLHEIAVPDLSIKERMLIDEMIFDEPIEQIHARIPFKFDEKLERSLFALQQYRLHYQRYPHFMRVIN
jgi:hypothetical protein